MLPCHQGGHVDYLGYLSDNYARQEIKIPVERFGIYLIGKRQFTLGTYVSTSPGLGKHGSSLLRSGSAIHWNESTPSQANWPGPSLLPVYLQLPWPAMSFALLKLGGHGTEVGVIVPAASILAMGSAMHRDSPSPTGATSYICHMPLMNSPNSLRTLRLTQLIKTASVGEGGAGVLLDTGAVVEIAVVVVAGVVVVVSSGMGVVETQTHFESWQRAAVRPRHISSGPPQSMSTFSGVHDPKVDVGAAALVVVDSTVVIGGVTVSVDVRVGEGSALQLRQATDATQGSFVMLHMEVSVVERHELP